MQEYVRIKQKDQQKFSEFWKYNELRTNECLKEVFKPYESDQLKNW